jgi:hypothetical protein
VLRAYFGFNPALLLYIDGCKLHLSRMSLKKSNCQVLQLPWEQLFGQILHEGQSSTVYKSDGIHIFSGCIFVLNKMSNKKMLLEITWYRCMARGSL